MFLQKKILFSIIYLSVILFTSCNNNRVNQFPQLNKSVESSPSGDNGPKRVDDDRNQISTDTVKNSSIKPGIVTKPADLDTVKGDYVSVTRVIDGDTFVIFNIYGNEEKVRLIGVNAPESRNSGKKKKEEFGEESKKYLTDLLKNARVKLEFDVQRVDKYGRTLAYVYLENGTLLNEYLVKSGYCQVATFPPNVKHRELFVEAERYAREHKTGLWK